MVRRGHGTISRIIVFSNARFITRCVLEVIRFGVRLIKSRTVNRRSDRTLNIGANSNWKLGEGQVCVKEAAYSTNVTDAQVCSQKPAHRYLMPVVLFYFDFAKAEWIGLVAFIDTLSTWKSVYKPVILSLQTVLLKLEQSSKNFLTHTLCDIAELGKVTTT